MTGELLLESHAGLHMLCHACRDPVAVISVPQGALLEVNRAFRAMFVIPEPPPAHLTIVRLAGLSLGRTLRSWDGKEPRLIRSVHLGGVEGQARLLGIPATFPVQAFFHFMPRTSPAPLEAGRLTELLDERLQQIRNFERLRSLGETAAVIVHEIRIPLSTIRLGVEGVRKSAALDPAHSSRLDVALEQLDRLDRLLRSIRNFAHPHRLIFEPLDVRETCQAALRGVEAALQGPNTSVVLQVRPDPLRIVADRERLSEAIQNILVNAVEAMPGGGTISLQSAPSRHRRGWIEIRVADTGTGIPSNMMSRMFQPFLTTKRTGTGLGLPIVKKIAELHGGFVSLKSAPGKGTTVILELPASPPGAMPSE